ncbi:hypothetical protein OIU85_021559 [Salix viminalis]|uniref:Uncharacterized protein n=1 Tax=Salix viminalis TaxID=40686 RepID=A0A9Q0ZDR8_SALVM|nr:hypothetical protein OIU85_021559 [Salix viminalis]
MSYEALRSEVEGGSQSGADQRVKEEMETKLGEIVDMLEYLVQQKNALGLREAGVEQMGGEDGRRSKSKWGRYLKYTRRTRTEKFSQWRFGIHEVIV